VTPTTTPDRSAVAPAAPPSPTALPAPQWRALASSHAQRADALTAGHRERRSRHERHAVEDFLFEYYPTKPAQLRRWHPGAGVTLLPDSDGPAPQGDWRWYATTPDGGVALDLDAFLADRGDTVRFVVALVSATSARPAATGCFGLHEWAMVYREGDAHRHPLPLRLGSAGTDAVVEGHRIRCTHFDAFRFFTPDAEPLNVLTPTRETQAALEQPGCLHANMDLYKWATKLGPLVPGDLLLDCFELAREIRSTDMQASPYDVSSYGLEPVAIETPAGKTEYVRRQREYASRSNTLRARLLTVVTQASAGRPSTPAPDGASAGVL